MALDLRDRALAGRKGRGAGRQPLHRVPGGALLVEGERGRRRAHRRHRASSATGRQGQSVRAAHRPHGAGHGALRGHAGHARPGVLRVAAASGRRNPQIFALGVKEIWETKRPLDAVIHTLGWPLPADAFGGSFMYPLAPNLDRARASWSGSTTAQPRSTCTCCCSGSSCIRCSARISRAARWSSGARRRFPRAATTRCRSAATATGVLIVGDAAGLRGRPVAQGDSLRHAVGDLRRARDLRRAQGGRHVGGVARAVRPDGGRTATSRATCTARATCGWRSRGGFYAGGIKAGLMTLTGGRFPGGRIAMRKRTPTWRTHGGAGVAVHARREAHLQQGGRGVQVGERDARHDPHRTSWSARTSRPRWRDFYTHLCPAGVYERDGDRCW